MVELYGLDNARAIRARIIVETGWSFEYVDGISPRRIFQLLEAIRGKYLDATKGVATATAILYNVNKKKESPACDAIDANPFYNNDERNEHDNEKDIATRKRAHRKQKEAMEQGDGVVRKTA